MANAMPRGAWFAADHEKHFGTSFKIKGIHGWGATTHLVRSANAAASRSLDVYQFGVYTAGSMKSMARRLVGFGHLYGFDSFQGLPEETVGMPLEGKHWNPGGFSAADALGEWRLSALLPQLYQKINRKGNVTLVPGFFNESLTPTLARRYPFQPALLVDIDVDLHSSTVLCLSWLLDNKLLQPGSFVRYDDWRNIGQRHGEARAHREVSQLYNVTWQNVRRPGAAGINVREWRVLSVGGRHN